MTWVAWLLVVGVCSACVVLTVGALLRGATHDDEEDEAAWRVGCRGARLGHASPSSSPGSREAHRLGCRCPVLDNHRGAGAFINRGGVPEFWIALDCPLHGALPDDAPKGAA